MCMDNRQQDKVSALLIQDKRDQHYDFKQNLL
jgi:hypothetical protein